MVEWFHEKNVNEESEHSIIWKYQDLRDKG